MIVFEYVGFNVVHIFIDNGLVVVHGWGIVLQTESNNDGLRPVSWTVQRVMIEMRCLDLGLGKKGYENLISKNIWVW